MRKSAIAPVGERSLRFMDKVIADNVSKKLALQEIL